MEPAFTKSHLKLCTQFLSHHCTFEWHVKDFSKHFPNLTLQTPEFSPVKECHTRWRLALDFIDGGLGVYFKRCDLNPLRFKTVFILSVENSSGQVLDQMISEDIHHFMGFRMDRPMTHHVVADARECSFKLQDDVLVVKGSIQLTDCCLDNSLVQKGTVDHQGPVYSF